MNAYQKNNPASIQALFASIASRYDLTNNILSFGLHKYWNRALVKSVLDSAPSGPLLDLCCGTGEIAYTYLKKKFLIQQTIYLIDFCNEMLEVAQKRALTKGYQTSHSLIFRQGDAQAIPLENSSVTGVSIAYGIRNVKDPKACLSETYRILQPGGLCGILELTRPNSSVIRTLHRCYLQAVIPTLGRLCTSNSDAYKYLRDSISSFIEPGELADCFKKTGFQNIQIIPLSFGAAHLLIGRKNLSSHLK